MSMLDGLLASSGRPEPLRSFPWGMVISDGSSGPVEVRFAGEEVAVEVSLGLTDYTPVVADKVALIPVGTQWLVIPFEAFV